MSKMSQAFKSAIESAFSERGARAEFLRRSGISQNTVHLWQKGERVPDLDQAEVAAKALGRPPQEILFPEDQELPTAWREIIRRVGSVDESQVNAVVAGIQGILASLQLDEADRLADQAKKLPRPPKR